ncbi:hypothetical protein VNO78_15890 [Psophocarpus tetragonolobus]|uniref:Transmembrane protein n=1 Tax=Psophocarpus tetragonolobus TaxID=3891 RepID=A0AAN9XKB3_PSOTE
MPASSVVLNLCYVASCFPNCCQNRTLVPTHHNFRSPNSLLRLKTKPFHLNTRFKSLRTQKPRSGFVVFAVQSNFVRVLQNAWKVGKDGIDAGSSLVPNSVPRPIARILVTIVALSVTLFVFKAFLSTAFFVLATIGLAYFAYLAFNKEQRPSGNGGTTSTPPMDDPVEEARKIMEKYK